MGEGLLFFKSMIVGLGIAAPVGPVGVLCVRRTLTGGPRLGLSSGLGAAVADSLYGAVAAFGLAAVGAWIVQHSEWLRLGGGLFLVCLAGWNLLRGPAAQGKVQADASNVFWAFCSTLFLTLANPVTLLSFAAIFAAVGVTHSADSLTAGLILVAGVFAGSSVWWFGLSGSVLALRNRVSLGWMKRIHYGSALLILLFGLYALVSYFLGDPAS